MVGKGIHEIKSVLKMQKSPVHVKMDIISTWKRKLCEQRITRTIAGGVGWLVLAGTLAGLLIRRTNGA